MTRIWHNPRCSKSRQTLALLEQNGVTPTIRLYLQDSPDIATLRETARLLGGNAAGMMRVQDRLFKQLGLSMNDPEDNLFAAMASQPALIERPIVFHNGKAAIGRPPEAVLELLQPR